MTDSADVARARSGALTATRREITLARGAYVGKVSASGDVAVDQPMDG
jgi:hypothetical protein